MVAFMINPLSLLLRESKAYRSTHAQKSGYIILHPIHDLENMERNASSRVGMQYLVVLILKIAPWWWSRQCTFGRSWTRVWCLCLETHYIIYLNLLHLDWLYVELWWIFMAVTHFFIEIFMVVQQKCWWKIDLKSWYINQESTSCQ